MRLRFATPMFLAVSAVASCSSTSRPPPAASPPDLDPRSLLERCTPAMVSPGASVTDACRVLSEFVAAGPLVTLPAAGATTYYGRMYSLSGGPGELWFGQLAATSPGTPATSWGWSGRSLLPETPAEAQDAEQTLRALSTGAPPPPASATVAYVRSAPPPSGFVPLVRSAGASLVASDRGTEYLRASANRLLVISIGEDPGFSIEDRNVRSLQCEELWAVP